MSARIAVLASGDGSNLQAIIEAIGTGQLEAEIGLVICDNEQARALKRASDASIPCELVERRDFTDKASFDQRLIDLIDSVDAKLVVLAGFMKILGENFINHFAGRILNIHHSLLPSFPGLNSIQQALTYGARYTGCTVHFVDSGIDTGPIVLQTATPIDQGENIETLTAKVHALEHQIYPQAIALFLSGKLHINGRTVTIKK
jgi:phosphoribosylglycinamide formyltransferase-1